jgi:uncharacterized protein YecE (DUF72 family)
VKGVDYMGRILVGLSSWADPELISSGFYPPEIKTSVERLSYYATKFPVVEMDSSYHFLPTRRNSTAWIEATPAGFLFEIKAFSLLTQHPAPLESLPRDMRDIAIDAVNKEGNLYLRNLPENLSQEIWSRFEASIQPFVSAAKLGAITFQFPPWFYPRPENYEYILECKEKLSRYRLAVEFRTGSWLSQEHRGQTLQLLRENGLALVCVDEPQGLKSSVPPLAEATASLSVVRFHGRNQENWERKSIPVTEKYNYYYNQDELTEWVPKIKSLSDNAGQVFVIFKNKHLDYALKNARQMIELLDKPASVEPGI